MFKGSTLRGLFVGGREHAEGLLRALGANRVAPIVDRVFDFGAAADAYAHLQARRHVGKVVIRI